MKFFSFFRQANGHPVGPSASATAEDPQKVTAPGSLLHPETPTGTRFNRKMIMVLGALAGLVMIFAFMSALQPPKKLDPQEEAEAKAAKGEKNINYAPTPETIQTAPDTYAALGKFEEEQQVRRGEIPSVKGALPGPEPGAVGSVKNISPGALNAYSAQAQPGAIPNTYPAQMPDQQKELVDARKSQIRFASASSAPAATAHQQPTYSAAQPVPVSLPTMPWQQPQDDQNMQDEKRTFIDSEKKKDTKAFYVKGSLTPALSKYEVKAGSIIPGVMITGINSDLPGRLTGQVRENVYDTVSGRYLLIPQGAKVIGTYDSKVAYAQDRVLIVWTRLIFPNGDSMDLEGMDGVDLSGYAGLKDKVNNHYAKLITGVVLSSILSAGAKVAAGNNDIGTATFPQQAASGAAQQVASAGAKFTDKNLNVQPTIEIRPGMKFNVFVNKDLVLKPYKDT